MLLWPQKGTTEICPKGAFVPLGPAGRPLGHVDVLQVPIHCLREALTPYADAVNSSCRHSV